MKRNNVSKSEILQTIKEANGLPVKFSNQIFEYIFDIFKTGLVRDGILKIPGFGTFKVLSKKERIGMNPKTKIKYPISARKVVVFSPSKLSRYKINGKK